jgi:IPTL-CTERM motif
VTLIRIISALFVCLLSLTILAQSYPAPPTPFPDPITGYLGRYLDSTSTSQGALLRNPPYRTNVLRVAPELDTIYAGMGFLVGTYDLSTFPSRVAGGPLATGPKGERYLPFNDVFDATQPANAWYAGFPAIDGHFEVQDIDWDQRGYTYATYGYFGTIILDANLNLVHAPSEPSDPSDSRVVVVRSAGQYRMLIGSFDSVRVYDVTNPAAPVFLRQEPRGIAEWAKSTTHVALTRSDGTLEIYSRTGLADGEAPVFTATPPAGDRFTGVTSDGTRFYAIQNVADFGSPNIIHVLSQTGETFSATTHPAFTGGAGTLSYGAGYLVGVRNAGAATTTFVLYRVGAGGITLANDTYFNWHNTGGFVVYRRAIPVMVNGQTILIENAYALGDVYTLAAQTPLTLAKQFVPSTVIRNSASRMTVTITNPNPTPVTSFSFTDTYPTNLANFIVPNAATSCGTGIVTTGTNSFTLTGGSLPANSSCQVAVNVTSNFPGSYTNTIPAGAISSADNTNTAASATLTVNELTAPSVTKAFASATATVGVPVHLQFTFTNPNPFSIVGLNFVDTYPAGLVNASPPQAFNTCGGFVNAAAGGGSLMFGGGTIPANGTCMVSVFVVATNAGTISNTMPAGSVRSGNSAPAGAVAPAVLEASVGGAPTLSEWALIVLSMFIAAVAVLRLR